MTDYPLLCKQIEAFMEGETPWLSVYANASALLYETLPEINWAGFYFLESVLSGDVPAANDALVLGPFQGKVACMRIGMGKGVCGTAALQDQAQLVPDVHAFAGHIACDAASLSEVVIPLHQDGKVIGVLDIDSPVKARFTEDDLAGLTAVAKVLERK